jgi:hypothetical protein
MSGPSSDDGSVFHTWPERPVELGHGAPFIPNMPPSFLPHPLRISSPSSNSMRDPHTDPRRDRRRHHPFVAAGTCPAAAVAEVVHSGSSCLAVDHTGPGGARTGLEAVHSPDPAAAGRGWACRCSSPGCRWLGCCNSPGVAFGRAGRDERPDCMRVAVPVRPVIVSVYWRSADVTKNDVAQHIIEDVVRRWSAKDKRTYF